MRPALIESFRHRGLKRLFEKGDRSKIRPDLAEKAKRILAKIDEAEEAEELNFPGYNLHKLTGDLKGFWSIYLSRNHRIIFRFENRNAYDVDLVDYH